MNNTGYTGLSFPLKISSKGGLKMTTTSPTDFTHIEESIKQILGTSISERVSELYFGSSISTHVFEVSDEASYSLIKHEIVESLRNFEKRIEVTTEGISLSNTLDEKTGKNFLNVTIRYKVIKYDRTSNVDIVLGED